MGKEKLKLDMWYTQLIKCSPESAYVSNRTVAVWPSKQKYEEWWQVFEVELEEANALERNQFSKELLLLFKKKWRGDTVSFGLFLSNLGILTFFTPQTGFNDLTFFSLLKEIISYRNALVPLYQKEYTPHLDFLPTHFSFTLPAKVS
jgi:hypothetical protein